MPPIQKMSTCIKARPLESALTSTAPRMAPQTVTTRRGEKAAPRKVASTISTSSVSSEPGELPEPRWFDYQPTGDEHVFTETARDCAFAGDTLVLVGEAYGKHEPKVDNNLRNRHFLLESDVTTTAAPVWTVAGLNVGVQTRALALDLDEQGRYHLVGDQCGDACEPDGELWTYEPGGKLVDHGSIGPLGSPWFGPHDIAWSPAGYAVVAFGEIQGQSFVFKVQAFVPGAPVPAWTFWPNSKQDLQLALAVAVGPYGEVYGGGVAVDVDDQRVLVDGAGGVDRADLFTKRDCDRCRNDPDTCRTCRRYVAG